MHAAQDDAQLLERQAGFLEDIERAIRATNQAIIHRRLPDLDEATVMRLAAAVAELRGRYLEAALAMIAHEDGVPPDQADINKIAKSRMMFEEAVAGFEALRRAIERGYVMLADKVAAE